MFGSKSSNVFNLTTAKLALIGCTMLVSANAFSSVIVDDFENQAIGGGAFYHTQIVTPPLLSTDAAGIDAVPGSSGTNSVIEASFFAPSAFAGIGHTDFDNIQNWDGFARIEFWLFGNNNGNELTFNIVNEDISGIREVWVNPFIDNFIGWQIVSFAFDSFSLASFSDVGDSALGLDRIVEWSFFAETRQGQGVIQSTYYLDDVKLVSAPAGILVMLFGLTGFVLARKIAKS